MPFILWEKGMKYCLYTLFITGCGGNFSSMSGSFSSPRFPDPYPNLSNCKYYIDVPVGYKINLTVVVFRTESSTDYLEVNFMIFFFFCC